MTDPTRELWAAFVASQNEGTFQPLYDRTKRLVWTLCRRVLGNEQDASDAFQATYLRLLLEVRAESFSEQHLANANQVLYRLAVREARNLGKRLQRRTQREIAMEPLPSFAAADPNANDLAAQKELRQQLEALLRLLPDDYRVPLQLHYFDGLSQTEIAEVLEINQASISRRITKGIKQLQPLVRRAGLGDALVALGVVAVGATLMHPPSAFSAALVFAQAHAALVAGVGAGGAAGATLFAKSAGRIKQSLWAAVKLKTTTALVAAAFIVGVGAILTLGAMRKTSAPVVTPNKAAIVRTGSVVHSDSILVAAATPPAFPALPSANARTNSQTSETHITAMVKAPSQQDEQKQFLTIHCTDQQGKPVENAEVYVAQRFGSWGMNMEPHTQLLTYGPEKTGADGSMKIQVARIAMGEGKGVIESYARVPGQFVGAGIRSDETTKPLAIIMVKSTRLQGNLSVPEGFTPDSVRVRVLMLIIHDKMFSRDNENGLGHLWPEIFECQSDANGNFTLGDVPTQGNTYLAANASGLGETQYIGVDPSLASPSSLTLAMEKEGVIQGVVSTGVNPKPVADAKVSARVSGAVHTFETNTDANGQYRIQGLSENYYVVKVLPNAQGLAPMRENVRVAPGETVKNIDFKLETGALVSGSVVDSIKKSPVKNVLIGVVSGHPSGEGIALATTDEQGHYELRLPSGKDMLYFFGIPKEYVYPKDQARQIVMVEPGKDKYENINFDLKPKDATTLATESNFEQTATAQGRVIDPAGKPVKGIPISDDVKYKYGEQEHHEAGDRLGYTDESGHYIVKLRSNAQYKLKVGGDKQSSAESNEFKTTDSSIHIVEDLTVRPGTASIAGRVIDASGTPLVGVQIAASSEHKRVAWNPSGSITDAQGHFVVDQVLDDEFLTIRAEKPGYERRRWNGVAPGAKDLELKMFTIDDPLYDVGRQRVHQASSMIGKPAPQWDVDHWVQLTIDPTPLHNDGKWTALMIVREDAEYVQWPKIIDNMREFETLCNQAGTIPVIVCSATMHDSIPLEAIRKYSLDANIAIDRFVPKSPYNYSSATQIAYGSGSMPLVFIIDPQGIIKYVQSGLSGLQSHLNH